MSEWKEYKLGEITDWFSGGTPSKEKKEYWSGSIPWISAKTMTDYKVSSSELNITEEGLSNGSRLACEKDILLLVRGSGLFIDIPINLVEKPVAFNQDIKAIRAKKSKYQDFIYFWLQGNKKGLNDILEETGIGAGKFDTDLLKKLEISIPTNNSEFDYIVETARAIFDKLDLLHRQNTTLEKMAETLFMQWFVEEAKEEWDEVELGKLIEVVIDNRGKTPPTVEFKTEYPLIEVNALNSQSCLVDYTVIRKYVTKETFDTWFRKHLKVNDIIISTVGTIGVFSIHLANKGCIAQNLVGLRSNKISSYFLYCFFKSNIETLINLDIGGVQPSIKVPHLLGLTIKLPPNELLNKFDESVENYFNKIAKNQSQIRTLTELRDTLLPKLMSGEVRVETN